MSQKLEEPPFVRKISLLQKVGASFAGSFFAMVWFTGLDVIKDIFKPDHIESLAFFRMIIAIIAITITCFVGTAQIKQMLLWVRDNYEIYRQITESKKKIKDE